MQWLSGTQRSYTHPNTRVPPNIQKKKINVCWWKIDHRLFGQSLDSSIEPSINYPKCKELNLPILSVFSLKLLHGKHGKQNSRAPNNILFRGNDDVPKPPYGPASLGTPLPEKCKLCPGKSLATRISCNVASLHLVTPVTGLHYKFNIVTALLKGHMHMRVRYHFITETRSILFWIKYDKNNIVGWAKAHLKTGFSVNDWKSGKIPRRFTGSPRIRLEQVLNCKKLVLWIWIKDQISRYFEFLIHARGILRGLQVRGLEPRLRKSLVACSEI